MAPRQETLGDRLIEAVNAAQEAVARGAAAPLDECVSFGLCTGPDDPSDTCDTCRNTAANVVISPSLVACRGTTYGPAPDIIRGNLAADTDCCGRIVTPFVVTFSRQPSTPVTFSGCATTSIEYTLNEDDKRRVQDWIQPYVDRGLHQMPNFSLLQGGVGFEEGDEDPFKLMPGAATCIGSTDAASCGFWSGAFLFGREVAQVAHGVVTPNPAFPTNPTGLGGDYRFEADAVFVPHP